MTRGVRESEPRREAEGRRPEGAAPQACIKQFRNQVPDIFDSARANLLGFSAEYARGAPATPFFKDLEEETSRLVTTQLTVPRRQKEYSFL